MLKYLLNILNVSYKTTNANRYINDKLTQDISPNNNYDFISIYNKRDNILDFLHNKGCVALASPTYGAKAPVPIPMGYARSLLTKNIKSLSNKLAISYEKKLAYASVLIDDCILLDEAKYFNYFNYFIGKLFIQVKDNIASLYMVLARQKNENKYDKYTYKNQINNLDDISYLNYIVKAIVQKSTIVISKLFSNKYLINTFINLINISFNCNSKYLQKYNKKIIQDNDLKSILA